jgi:hypothetical protein
MFSFGMLLSTFSGIADAPVHDTCHAMSHMFSYQVELPA